MQDGIPIRRVSRRIAAVAAALVAVAALALAGLLWLFLAGGGDQRELPNNDAASTTPLLVSIRDPLSGTRIAASDPTTTIVA